MQNHYYYQVYKTQRVLGSGVCTIDYIDIYRRTDVELNIIESPLQFVFRKERDHALTLEDDLVRTLEKARESGLMGDIDITTVRPVSSESVPSKSLLELLRPAILK